MNQYEAFKIIRESNMILERRSSSSEPPIQAIMDFSWTLGSRRHTFDLKSFQSSVPQAFKDGATAIYNYRGTRGTEPVGTWWWLCLSARVKLSDLSCGAGTIMRIDDAKAKAFKDKLKEKYKNIGSTDNPEYPSLEEILEFGMDLSNWKCSSSYWDLDATKDGRKCNVLKAILSISGGNYKPVPLNRKNIRLLNKTLKSMKEEEITEEELKAALEDAETKFPDKDHNFSQMMRALSMTGFTDMKALDNGPTNDYGEKYVGTIIAKYKGNPVWIDTTASAFGRCGLYTSNSRCISQAKYDELNKKYSEFNG